MERLRALPVFADGPLAERRPQLKVRRAAANRTASASRSRAEFRLSVTAYPGIRPGDVLETLLHELVHLHVGRAAEAHAWHGPTFKRTLGQAMREAYGVTIRPPRSTLHGAYAEAIETQSAETAKKTLRVLFAVSRSSVGFLLVPVPALAEAVDEEHEDHDQGRREDRQRHDRVVMCERQGSPAAAVLEAGEAAQSQSPPSG